MKKVLLGLLAVTFISIGSTATVNADLARTDITGVVTDNHVAVNAAMVTAECNGGTRTDTTDSHGSYLVNFPSGDCPFGSTVKVTAQKNGKSGVSSGTVRGVTTKLNLAIVNVSIPEYGMVGALTAASVGAGLIFYTRRRQQQIGQF